MGEEKSEQETAAKMIMPPRPVPNADMGLAIKAMELAIEIMRRHTCWPLCRNDPTPPIPGPEPLRSEMPPITGTQVDVGEDTEREV